MTNIDTDAILGLVAYASYLVVLSRSLQHRAQSNSINRSLRDAVHTEFMSSLETNVNPRSILRMNPSTFQHFVSILRGRSFLRDSQYSVVEEQVAEFLHILGSDGRNRNMCFYFRRSGETISRHFHQVLRAVISLEDLFLVQPNGSTTPQEISSDSRFYPYFKHCIGAIDGTRIRAKVPKEIVSSYRGKKDFPTMNVLVACTFDLRFTYVLPGWEGSASDSRVLENVLNREEKLVVPPGKFYLLDGGYMLRSGFITPYRSTRYHLKEFSHHRPENLKELFSLRHSSLRTAIERAFGVLKKRFPIIASGTKPQYDVDTVSEIFLACCIIHNFLMGVDLDDELIAEVDREVMEGEYDDDDDDDDVQNNIGTISRSEDGGKGQLIRDIIATKMWEDYNRRH